MFKFSLDLTKNAKDRADTQRKVEHEDVHIM